MAVKKYVSLEKLSLYDEKIKQLISDADAATLASAKKYTDDSVKLCDAAGAANTALADAKSYTDTEVAKANAAAADAKTQADKGVADAAAAKVAADAAQADVDALEAYVGTFTASEGVDTVVKYIDAKTANIASDETVSALADRVAQAETDIDNIEKDYLKASDKTALEGQISAVQTAVNTEKSRAEGIESGLNTRLAAVEGDYLKAADKTELQNNIDAVDDRVDILVGSDAGKSARTIANEELAKQLIPETAKESLDTLAEIAAWIQSHPDDASAMNTAIEALQNKVTLGVDGEGNEYATVKAYVEAAIAALNIGDYAKATELTSLASRVSTLETASATHATKTEVEAISTALDGYKDTHKNDYTNTQIDSAIKAVDDKVTALNDTYATDEELAQAISNEVTRANGAYAAKSLETTVQEHKDDTVVHITADERTLWNSALHASDITIGTANGTIAVKGTDVAVKGLGSAAFTESSAYDVAGAAAAVDAKLTTEKERAEAAEAALGARIDEFVECSQEDINALFA